MSDENNAVKAVGYLFGLFVAGILKGFFIGAGIVLALKSFGYVISN